MESHTNGKMSIGKKIDWVHTLLSSFTAWQVFTFRKVLFWLGKYEHEEERKYFIYRLSLLHLVHVFILDCSIEAGSSQCWWQKRWQMQKSISISSGLWSSPGCPTLVAGTVRYSVEPQEAPPTSLVAWHCRVPPRQLYLPLCPKTWMRTERKKRQKLQKTGGRHSGSHTVLLMLTSLRTGLPVEAFEDLFGWRYASVGCLRPAAGAELVGLDLPLHPSPKGLTKAAWLPSGAGCLRERFLY